MIKRIGMALPILGILISTGVLQAGEPRPTNSGTSTTTTSVMDRILGKPMPPKYSPEEMQLQIYWSSYYRSLANYYASLNNVDWVAYYKQNGYPIDPRFYNPQGLPTGVPVIPMQISPAPKGMMPPRGSAIQQTGGTIPGMGNPQITQATCSTCNKANCTQCDKAKKTNPSGSWQNPVRP